MPRQTCGIGSVGVMPLPFETYSTQGNNLHTQCTDSVAFNVLAACQCSTRCTTEWITTWGLLAMHIIHV